MWWWRLLLVGFSLFVFSCRSVPYVATQPSFSPDTPARRAVLSFRQTPEAKPVHAEALVRYEPPSSFQLTAWKGPLPWINVQMTTTGWRIDIPSRHESVTGHDVCDAPGQLSVWLMIREELARRSDLQKLAVTGRDGSRLQLHFSQYR